MGVHPLPPSGEKGGVLPSVPSSSWWFGVLLPYSPPSALPPPGPEKNDQNNSKCCFCKFWDHGIWPLLFVVAHEVQGFFVMGGCISMYQHMCLQ